MPTEQSLLKEEELKAWREVEAHFEECVDFHYDGMEGKALAEFLVQEYSYTAYSLGLEYCRKNIKELEMTECDINTFLNNIDNKPRKTASLFEVTVAEPESNFCHFTLGIVAQNAIDAGNKALELVPNSHISNVIRKCDIHN